MKRLETKSLNRSSPPPPPTPNHFLSNKLETFCLGHFSISIASLSLFLINTQRIVCSWRMCPALHPGCWKRRCLVRGCSLTCANQVSLEQVLNAIPHQSPGSGKWWSLAMFPPQGSNSAFCCHDLDGCSMTVHSPSAFVFELRAEAAPGKPRACPPICLGQSSLFFGGLSLPGPWAVTWEDPDASSCPHFCYYKASPATGQEGTHHPVHTATSSDSAVIWHYSSLG